VPECSPWGLLGGRVCDPHESLLLSFPLLH
jgi:hypothetical protein